MELEAKIKEIAAQKAEIERLRGSKGGPSAGRSQGQWLGPQEDIKRDRSPLRTSDHLQEPILFATDSRAPERKLPPRDNREAGKQSLRDSNRSTRDRDRDADGRGRSSSGGEKVRESRDYDGGSRPRGNSNNRDHRNQPICDRRDAKRWHFGIPELLFSFTTHKFI